MEDLAGKLCEAVENEDYLEVENLLKYGADPNLVLPNGIAAIHLASGKESECALRCLTMILQHGGDPNVRSTDDLTPVHVAASWGCCKALIFLLRKGGDPSIQDQDGNTALDLALMENNRRCAIALEEYKERISGYTDEICEMSCITLLLESTYENSPLSSTKISPMTSFPKTATLGNHMADEAILGLVEVPVFGTKDESRKEQEMCYSTKIVRDDCELNPTETKVPVPFTRTSRSGYSSEYFATHSESDPKLNNSSMRKKIYSDVSIKTHPLFDNDWENNSINGVNEAITPNTHLSNYTDSVLQQNFKCNGELGLNCIVTFPHNDYAYKKDYSDEKMEDTMFTCDNVSETENLEEHETYSRSKYNDCNTGLWGKNDVRILSNKLASKTMNAQSSGLVDAWKEDIQAVESEVLTGTCTQINSERNRILTVEGINTTVRTSKMQCNLQSSTLPVEATNYEPDSQDLQIQLKNLLLSTKGYHRIGSEVGCVDSLPVSSETEPLQCGQVFNQNMKDLSSSKGAFTVESCEHHVKEKSVSELQEDLKNSMSTNKNFHSLSTTNEDKSSFFTPRTKSRLHFFKFRQNVSSLFDDSVEMPKHGRRVRRPDGLLASNTNDLPPDDFLRRRSSNSPSVTYKLLKISNTLEKLNNDFVKKSPEMNSTYKIPQDHKETFSEPETTVCMSNFLTDDLSSANEDNSCLQLKQSTSNHCSDDGISLWLTEDNESEISGVADHKRKISSNMEEKSGPASLFNRSFFHSTLPEHTAVNGCKDLQYSFSRLSCIPKADESTLQSCSSIVRESAEQEVPLSPGGRPVNISQVETAEYLYKDNEKGHVLIEKRMPSIDQSSTDAAGKSPNTIIHDWRNCKINTLATNKASSINSPNRVAVELYRLSNDDIASRLRVLGVDSGQITSQNRKMCILLLDRHLKEETSNGPAGLSFKYSPELSLALHTFNIPDCNMDEADLSREFDQPDKTQKWREGVLKASFNYLLLDPRLTRNLPSRCYGISQLDCFRTFVSAIFYVGKGKQSRPYCHLYEALNYYKGNCKKLCSKVQHIIDIWKSGQGVLSLHCFQNTIPVEAYTREACMVDAIGLKMLTNQKKGIYYGQVQSWSPTRQRRLGVDMLYKAMQIFLAEGERQLRPPDISSAH